MIQYEVETSPIQKVIVSLAMEAYCGCELPTIRLNGIAIAHFLPDGRLCLRDNSTISACDYELLKRAGITLFNKSSIQTVQARDLK